MLNQPDFGRGIWTKDVLMTTPGPWDERRPPSNSITEQWKRIVDWSSEHGFDRIIANGFKDEGIKHGWSFHRVLDFQKHKEANMYSREEKTRGRETIREILTYVKKKGLAFYVHHFNFLGPSTFVKAHPQMQTRWLITKEDLRLTKDDPAYLRLTEPGANVYGNLCWSQDVYQSFMKSCWEETFAAFPDLDGLMVTIGEQIFCACEYCRDKRRLAVNFGKFFIDTMRSLEKNPLIRTWYIMDLFADFPKGATMVSKHGLFDVCVPEPEEEVHEWVKAGHDVWLSKVAVGENNSFFIWANPKHFWDVARCSRGSNVRGFICIFTIHHWGLFSESRIQQLNQMALAEYSDLVSDQLPYDPAPWEEYLSTIAGDGVGKSFLEALELHSSLLLDLGRVVGASYEGFQPNWFYPASDLIVRPRTWWPGDLGTFHGAPPAPWRADLLSFPDIMRFIDENCSRVIDVAKMKPVTVDTLRELASSSGKTLCFDLLTEDLGKARKALDISRAIGGRVCSDLRSEFHLWQTHVEATIAFGEYWLNLLLAKMYYDSAFNLRKNMHWKEFPLAASQAIQTIGAATAALRLFDGLMQETTPSKSLSTRKGMDWLVNIRLRELSLMEEEMRTLFDTGGHPCFSPRTGQGGSPFWAWFDHGGSENGLVAPPTEKPGRGLWSHLWEQPWS